METENGRFYVVYENRVSGRYDTLYECLKTEVPDAVMRVEHIYISPAMAELSNESGYWVDDAEEMLEIAGEVFIEGAYGAEEYDDDCKPTGKIIFFVVDAEKFPDFVVDEEVEWMEDNDLFN